MFLFILTLVTFEPLNISVLSRSHILYIPLCLASCLSGPLFPTIWQTCRLNEGRVDAAGLATLPRNCPLTWCLLACWPLKYFQTFSDEREKKKLLESFLERDMTRASFSKKSEISSGRRPKNSPLKRRMRWKPRLGAAWLILVLKSVIFQGSAGRFFFFFLTVWMSGTTWDCTFHEVCVFLFFFPGKISVPL